jgi:hypothetical protein
VTPELGALEVAADERRAALGPFVKKKHPLAVGRHAARRRMVGAPATGARGVSPGGIGVGHDVSEVAGGDARLDEAPPAIAARRHRLAAVIEAVPVIDIRPLGPWVPADQIPHPATGLVLDHERHAAGRREIVGEGHRAGRGQVGPGGPRSLGVPRLGLERDAALGAEREPAPGGGVLPEEDPIDLLRVCDDVDALQLPPRLVVTAAPVEVQPQGEGIARPVLLARRAHELPRHEHLLRVALAVGMLAKRHPGAVGQARREGGLLVGAGGLAEVRVQRRLVAPCVVPGGQVHLGLVVDPHLHAIAGPAAVVLARLVRVDLVAHRRPVEPAEREIEALGFVHRRRPHRRHARVLAGLGAAVDRAAQIPVGQVAVDRDRPGGGHGHQLGVGGRHGSGRGGESRNDEQGSQNQCSLHGRSDSPRTILTRTRSDPNCRA